MFKGTRAFIARPYKVDFIRKKVSIAGYDSIFEYVLDFIFDLFLVKVFPYTILSSFITGVYLAIVDKLYFSIPIILHIFVLYLNGFFAFNLIYFVFDWEILRQMQMALEK